jgi:2-succinyl-5-enolpyruvyl-6-hydroxy-3-cyclohexene-1-carboxylate synthase
LRYQPIYDIAEHCARQGITHAVLCPGSRCAPLTLAFSRHPDIVTRTFSDERSAAFVALGIAQQTLTPVVLICTSGSAAYNFAPAIAEAYYAHIPLLVFTADRPMEWIGQLDGQAIQQQNIYGNHVKKSYNLPGDYDHPDAVWHIGRVVNEAALAATDYPRGPVHINAPFREPLYPSANEAIHFSKTLRPVDTHRATPELSGSDIAALGKTLTSFDKVLLVAGQGDYDEPLLKAAEKFSKQQFTPLVGDVISNLHSLPGTIRFADAFLAPGNESLKKTIRPDLLITFGKSVLSKSLKLFLRDHKPEQHWHIQEAGTPADTFQSLTRFIQTSPFNFFDSLLSTAKKSSGFEAQKRENYFRLWEAEEHRMSRAVEEFFTTPALHELSLVHEILRALPARCNLHLANSMSVRYANFIGLEAGKKGIRVFSNRGTSGIDGCTSTAVGHALVSDVPNFLVTGDMAFFYDRNAFWHNYPIPNLRVVVLNNHGGIIFSMIDGPGTLAEKEEYFVTRQRLTAQSLALDFDFDYLRLDNVKKLKNSLKDFFSFDGRTKILELDSTQALNKQIFENFKKHLKKSDR